MALVTLDEKICSQRNTGSSLVTIARRLNISVSRVEKACTEDTTLIAKLLSSKWNKKSLGSLNAPS